MTRNVFASALHLNPIVSYRSYWATHFYSVIQCLRYHTTLAFPARDFRRLQPDWSLNSLRGVAPPYFFASIEKYMQNWGFQYLLVSLLNSYTMAPLVEALIEKVGELFDARFDAALSNKKFHISGVDSELSRGLNLLFADVFPSTILGEFPDRQSLVANSDICLILNDPRTHQRVGIFGEIEGLHGEYLGRETYWRRKDNIYSVFALGIVPEKGNGIFMETRRLAGVDRVLITFQTEHSVAYDFRLALHWVYQLFNDGPNRRCEIADEELGFFVGLIKGCWHMPSSELQSTLNMHIRLGDMVNSEPGPTLVIPHLQS